MEQEPGSSGVNSFQPTYEELKRGVKPGEDRVYRFPAYL